MARILDCLLADGVCGEVVNVASGVQVPLSDLVAHLETGLGVVARKTFRSAPLRYQIYMDKLFSLVPVARTLGIGPSYFREVLDRYLLASVSSTDRQGSL